MARTEGVPNIPLPDDHARKGGSESGVYRLHRPKQGEEEYEHLNEPGKEASVVDIAAFRKAKETQAAPADEYESLNEPDGSLTPEQFKAVTAANLESFKKAQAEKKVRAAKDARDEEIGKDIKARFDQEISRADAEKARKQRIAAEQAAAGKARIEAEGGSKWQDAMEEGIIADARKELAESADAKLREKRMAETTRENAIAEAKRKLEAPVEPLIPNDIDQARVASLRNELFVMENDIKSRYGVDVESRAIQKGFGRLGMSIRSMFDGGMRDALAKYDAKVALFNRLSAESSGKKEGKG